MYIHDAIQHDKPTNGRADFLGAGRSERSRGVWPTEEEMVANLRVCYIPKYPLKQTLAHTKSTMESFYRKPSFFLFLHDIPCTIVYTSGSKVVSFDVTVISTMIDYELWFPTTASQFPFQLFDMCKQDVYFVAVGIVIRNQLFI